MPGLNRWVLLAFGLGVVAVVTGELARVVSRAAKRQRDMLRYQLGRVSVLLVLVCVGSVAGLAVDTALDPHLPPVEWALTGLIGAGLAETGAVLVRALRAHA